MLDYDLKRGTLTIKLSGDIDHSNAPAYRIGADSLIKKGGYERFVFDLSDVSFMDSTAVGLIMGRYKLLKTLNIPVFFYKPSSVADKVLKVSGLYTIISKI